ncbi:hypothetical protein KUTeg_003903, partial [Tegillarca granosa]
EIYHQAAKVYFQGKVQSKEKYKEKEENFLPELPKSLKDVEIDDDWKRNIFRYLCRSTIWYGDGTFSIAPRHFFQLYTIHKMVMGQLLPLIYCLLTKKFKDFIQGNKKTAEEMEIDLLINSFRVDFEDAVIQAMK